MVLWGVGCSADVLGAVGQGYYLKRIKQQRAELRHQETACDLTLFARPNSSPDTQVRINSLFYANADLS